VKHPHLIVLGLLMLIGGSLMCAGFVFVGGTIWYGQHRQERMMTKAVYAPPVAAPVAPQAPVAVPARNRGITFRTGYEVAPDGFLPGSRVDIIGKLPDTDNGDKLVTKVIVEDVMVLATGGGSSKEVVTVAVTPDEAERLVAAKERGALTVVLRRPGE